jgi:hypothetical protein
VLSGAGRCTAVDGCLVLSGAGHCAAVDGCLVLIGAGRCTAVDGCLVLIGAGRCTTVDGCLVLSGAGRCTAVEGCLMLIGAGRCTAVDGNGSVHYQQNYWCIKYRLLRIQSAVIYVEMSITWLLCLQFMLSVYICICLVELGKILCCKM